MVRTSLIPLGTALLATCAVALGGCRVGGSPSAGAGGRLAVVAAENTWGSLVAQIAGTKADVASIITNPAVDPHDYEPTPADARRFATADYVVVNGIGYDAWARKLLAANPERGRVVLDVGDLVGVHAGGNPHQWYSPASVHAFVARVARDLGRLDPAHAAYYEQQRDTLEHTRLRAYDDTIASIRDRFRGVAIGASESIVVPIVPALGVRLATPVPFLDAISEGNDPSASDKRTADRQITGRQIAVFVFNPQNSTPDVQRLVDAARTERIPVVRMTDTLTPRGATFEAWQTRQLVALRDALATAVHR